MTRILLVDDDELLRNTLHKVLIRAGYDVEVAADGTAALRAYHSQPCDLVITDILMPQTEGLETIRQLRRLDPNLKIIAMSGGGMANTDYLNLASKFGATRILVKPFSGAEIVAVVAEVLGPLPGL